LETDNPDELKLAKEHRGAGRRILITVVVLAVVLAAAFIVRTVVADRQQGSLDEQAAAAADAPPAVDVVRVKFAPTTSLLKLPGETRAWYQSTIYARVNGYLAQWQADIGDRVSKGQVLATIDTPELDDQLAGAEAKLKASEADVNVQQANSAFAKTTYDRWWQSPKGVVSDQEREEKKAEYDSSVARLKSSEAQVNLDRAAVDSLQALMKFKQVIAPFDGVITARRIDIGDLVTAGSTSSTTSLYTLAQSDQIRVFVDVPQSACVGLKVGMPTQTTTSEYPGRAFEGKVARTADAIDPISRTLHVEVDILNSDLALLPGMYVQVQFQVPQKGLIQIPASAMLFRSGGPQVAVVDADGKVRFLNIAIVHDMGDVIDIAAGLSSGDRVAMNISSQVSDGDTVAASEVDNVASSERSPQAVAAGKSP
jgi:RND family efflux transporter MFP subunit